MRDWLSLVGIRTDYFSVAAVKTALPHTVLIEDNPALALNGQTLLLHDLPWNRHIEAVRLYRR